MSDKISSIGKLAVSNIDLKKKISDLVEFTYIQR